MLQQRQYHSQQMVRLPFAKQLIAASLSGELTEGNARLVRNIIERAIRKQAVRLEREDSIARSCLQSQVAIWEEEEQ